MDSTTAEFIEVGTLLRPHGLKGEIRVALYADSPDSLKGGIYLQSGNRPPRPATITSLRFHQGRLTVTLEGVEDRNGAEALRGQTVLVPAAALPEPGPEEIYLYRLLGIPITLQATGEELGILDHVLFHGDQEIWAIRTPSGKEILFPAVPDFVDLIDLEAGIIRISPPPGLIELYVGNS